ncbi:MAG: HK97 family phage prohead protease [Bdellovibrionales bacterium]|jgi:hypothetical protein
MTIHHFSGAMEIKSIAQDGTFTGYASVFGELDSQNEIVERGAFTRTLAKWRVKNSAPAMLWMHDPTQPIGLWIAMAEDASGLVVHGRLALGTQKGMEAYELLKMKALTGLSIGYRVVTSRIDSKKKAKILTEVDLFEVSLVTFPANDAARVSGVKAPPAKAPAKKRQSDKVAAKKAAARLKKAARTLRGRG